MCKLFRLRARMTVDYERNGQQSSWNKKGTRERRKKTHEKESAREEEKKNRKKGTKNDQEQPVERENEKSFKNKKCEWHEKQQNGGH